MIKLCRGAWYGRRRSRSGTFVNPHLGLASRASTAAPRGSRSFAMTSSTTVSSILKYSWTRKLRIAAICRHGISGRSAVVASGSAFTASPMIPISRRIADTVGVLASQGFSVVMNLGDGGLNVGESVARRSGHNAMACLRADSDTPFFNSSSQATSTGIMSNSSSSKRMPDSRESRLPLAPPAARSSNISTSLPGPAVPRAIDPNSRGLLAPYLFSTSRIASRFSARRARARLLYVLVTLPILRLISDNPRALEDSQTSGVVTILESLDLHSGASGAKMAP